MITVDILTKAPEYSIEQFGYIDSYIIIFYISFYYIVKSSESLKHSQWCLFACCYKSQPRIICNIILIHPD